MAYNHLGMTVSYGGEMLEARAEVGLLTHNILFRGSVNDDWNDAIEPCDAGFDPGKDFDNVR